MIWAVGQILRNLICGYSSQGIAANFTQQDPFVKAICCCKSLFCGSSMGLWVLWHFNQVLSVHNSFSSLRTKRVSSGKAQGERSLLLRQLTRTAAVLNSLAVHSTGSVKERGAEPKVARKIFQGKSSTFRLSLLAFLQISNIYIYTVCSMLSNLCVRITKKTYF